MVQSDGPLVGRLISGHGRSGTAFIYGLGLAVTAFHCVGDRKTGAVRTGPFRLRLQDGQDLDCVYCDGDPEHDLAVLAFDHDLSVSTVELGRPPTEDRRWSARGYPPGVIGDHPWSLGGVVRDPDARFLSGVEALQLFSEEVGSGLQVPGLSGAAVTVKSPRDGRDSIVGMIRWIPRQRDDETLAVGGMVFASHAYKLAELLRKIGKLDPKSVFVSFADEDEYWAEQAVDAIRQEGLHVISRLDWPIGVPVKPHVRAALARVAAVVFMVSTAYHTTEDACSIAERDTVGTEVGMIPGGSLEAFVPVMLERCRQPDFIEVSMAVKAHVAVARRDVGLFKQMVIAGVRTALLGRPPELGIPIEASASAPVVSPVDALPATAGAWKGNRDQVEKAGLDLGQILDPDSDPRNIGIADEEAP